MNYLFSCENGILMTSQLRHCTSIDGTFYNFSVTPNVRLIHAINCEKLPKFVKVMAKILSVLFSGHCVYGIPLLNLLPCIDDVLPAYDIVIGVISVVLLFLLSFRFIFFCMCMLLVITFCFYVYAFLNSCQHWRNKLGLCMLPRPCER